MAIAADVSIVSLEDSKLPIHAVDDWSSVWVAGSWPRTESVARAVQRPRLLADINSSNEMDASSESESWTVSPCDGTYSSIMNGIEPSDEGKAVCRVDELVLEGCAQIGDRFTEGKLLPESCVSITMMIITFKDQFGCFIWCYLSV